MAQHTIDCLPAKDLKVKAPIPVRIRKKKGRYYADVAKSMGLLMTADSTTPERAKKKLAKGLVLQYDALRHSPRRSIWKPFHKLLLAGMREFIKEEKAA